MKRSFSNRILGGVCGGLASSLPLNTWLWRLIFILLTLVTFGAGALVYVMLWWVLPLDSPLDDGRGGALSGLVGILLGVAVIGLWFGRGALGLEIVAYWAIAVLIVAVVFLLKQVITGRLENIAVGLVAVAVPLIFVLSELDVLQAGAVDILLRALPAVLIFIGLTIALRYRVKFGSWIALIICVALVGGLASFAYSSRVDVVSEANQVVITVPNEDDNDLAEIGEDVTTLLIDVRTLDTDVQVTVSDSSERVITGEFLGSNNSAVSVNYSEDGSVASMAIGETQVSEFPLLQDMGRGSLELEIPTNIAIGLTFNGRRADVVNFDLAAINLERLQMTLGEGDVFVRLPDYQPQSPTVIADGGGLWTVRDGNLTVAVPSELGVQFALDRGSNPEPSNFDNLIYELGINQSDNLWIVETRQYANLDSQMRFRVTVSGGQFVIDDIDR